MYSPELFHCLVGWMANIQTHTHIFLRYPHLHGHAICLILFEYLQFYKVKKIENDDGRESEWQKGMGGQRVKKKERMNILRID